MQPERPMVQAMNWAKRLPPYTRLWIDDEQFAALAEDMAKDARVFSEYPATTFACRFRTVTFMPKSAYQYHVAN